MICNKCGKYCNSSDKFCIQCGNDISNYTPNPSYNNQDYQQTYNSNVFKSNNVIIIIVVSVFVVLVLGIVILLTNIDLKNTKEINNTATVAVVSTKVKVGNYTFEVPSNYTYEIDRDFIYVTDETNWRLEISGSEYSYSQIVSNKDRLNGGIIVNGMICTNPQIKTYNDVEFFIFDVNKRNTGAIVGFAKGNNDKAIVIVAYNKYNTIDYTLLEKMAPIIKSATYSTTSYGVNLPQYEMLGFTLKSRFDNRIVHNDN